MRKTKNARRFTDLGAKFCEHKELRERESEESLRGRGGSERNKEPRLLFVKIFRSHQQKFISFIQTSFGPASIFVVAQGHIQRRARIYICRICRVNYLETNRMCYAVLFLPISSPPFRSLHRNSTLCISTKQKLLRERS